MTLFPAKLDTMRPRPPATVTRFCRFCGAPIPEGKTRSMYCCENCRRQYQNVRRKAERREVFEAFGFGVCPVCGKRFRRRHELHFYCNGLCSRKAYGRGWEAHPIPMEDPWQRHDLDDWTAAQMFENANLDPLPVGMDGEVIGGALVVCRGSGWNKKKRKRAGPSVDPDPYAESVADGTLIKTK